MKRIAGFDLARAVAVAGMVAVDFKVAMFAERRGPGWLQQAAGLLDGRAAAMFVILAGVGASLMTASARGDGDLAALEGARQRMLRRAGFLLIVGYLFVPIWPADILHCYAFYIGIGAFLLAASDRALWLWAALAAALFCGLYSFAGYWDQLDVVDLNYRGLWTPVGLVRNLLFNGWHPVLPWVGLFLVGMWLGRRDVRSAATRWRIIVAAALVAGAAEAVAAFNPIVFDIVATGPSTLGVVAGRRALLAAEPLPPGPIYLLAAGGTAIVVILLCVGIGSRWPAARPVRWGAATGELALTIYVGHVLVGMGTLGAMGRLGSQTLSFALGAAAVFIAAAAAFAVIWRRFRRRGPVESLMRLIAG
ncbi:MAG: DUF1624 domain-containing protein [Actinobacteria bacterium]|nr:DUF1624 domain-containing protein [Actinomycetota bacterium]MBU1493528.1 DUF1624 domain-containing protein [Actinomycetota bacterium]MBU1866432.1 DUF1624 domain-containing protein [Actinomycetota bacterium]